jgi:hypothetical protein
MMMCEGTKSNSWEEGLPCVTIIFSRSCYSVDRIGSVENKGEYAGGRRVESWLRSCA